MVFYGDDTWGKLFEVGKPNQVFTRANLTLSFFVTDFVQVDLNVTYNVERELSQLDQWDVMIAHYLGVDHIGHSHGYHSDLFPEKLLEMDQVFRNIFDSLTENNVS